MQASLSRGDDKSLALQKQQQQQLHAAEDDDEDDSGEAESDEDDDDDEEEEEPKLKYHRLGANVVDILKRDSASCMAVHDRFLALGTHWGVVYVLDFAGNEIKRYSLLRP